MKLSQGFSRAGWSIATIVGQIASFVGLLLATKHPPISIAYPAWTRYWCSVNNSCKRDTVS